MKSPFALRKIFLRYLPSV